MAAAAVGAVFGAILCWSGMANPDVIREALLFESSYLFLFFGSAVLTAAVGTELLRRRRRRTLIGDAPLAWSRERPERRHVVGSVIFGVGWGVANACPGPIAVQVGQAIPWAAFTLVGLVGGMVLFFRVAGLGETEPPSDAQRPTAAAAIDPSIASA